MELMTDPTNSPSDAHIPDAVVLASEISVPLKRGSIDGGDSGHRNLACTCTEDVERDSPRARLPRQS